MATAAAGRLTQRIGTKLGNSSNKVNGLGCCPSSGTACGTSSCPIEKTVQQFSKKPSLNETTKFRESIRNKLNQTKQPSTNTANTSNTTSSKTSIESGVSNITQLPIGSFGMLNQVIPPQSSDKITNSNQNSNKSPFNSFSTGLENILKPEFQNQLFINKTPTIKKHLLTSKRYQLKGNKLTEKFQIPSLFSIYHHIFTYNHQKATIIQKHIRRYIAKKTYLETAIMQGLDGLSKLTGNDKVVKRLLPKNLNELTFPFFSYAISTSIYPTANSLGKLININDVSKLENLSLSEIRNKAMLAKLKRAIKNENLIELSSLNGNENVIDNLSNNEKLTLSSLLKKNISSESYFSFDRVSNLASYQIKQFQDKFKFIFNKISSQLHLHPLKNKILTIVFEQLSTIKNPAIGSFNPLTIKNENNFYEKILLLHDKIENLNQQQLEVTSIKSNITFPSTFNPTLLFAQHIKFPTQFSPSLLTDSIPSQILLVLSSECEKIETLIICKNNILKEINTLLSSNQFEDEGNTDVESSVDDSEHNYNTNLEPHLIELNSLKFDVLSTKNIQEIQTYFEIVNKVSEKINTQIKAKKIEIFLNKRKKEGLMYLEKLSDTDFEEKNKNIIKKLKDVIFNKSFSMDDYKSLNQIKTTILTKIIQSKNDKLRDYLISIKL